ncbi:MAG TPA: VOC family protein [Polyangiaceae bacterium]|nr:VOC family protein [Polyangiaceae bacterium]
MSSAPTGAPARSLPLHHLALGTAEVEGLARFYREVFGLEETARQLDAQGGLRSIWLDLGGVVLMIERSEGHRPRVEGVGSGLFLMAFRVTPPERARLELELEARGQPIEGRTAFTSYARDPDGNRLAISHHPET